MDTDISVACVALYIYCKVYIFMNNKLKCILLVKVSLVMARVLKKCLDVAVSSMYYLCVHCHYCIISLCCFGVHCDWLPHLVYVVHHSCSCDFEYTLKILNPSHFSSTISSDPLLLHFLKKWLFESI
jgi:hypothetical protein